MRDDTIARNYAEALFDLAAKHDQLAEFGSAIGTVAELLETDPKFSLFLATPRVDADAKKAVVRKAFGGTLPQLVVNFVLVTIDKRRQRLLRSISAQYHALLDAHMGREHVQVTVARPLDDAAKTMVAQRLSASLGKEAIPHVQVDPDILGGIVVRTGDTIFDGSVRRRLDGMRRRLLEADLPQ